MRDDLACILTLCYCDLLKYARLELIKGQEDLLRWIIQRWDEHEQFFRIGDQELEINQDDFNFLLFCHVVGHEQTSLEVGQIHDLLQS